MNMKHIARYLLVALVTGVVFLGVLAFGQGIPLADFEAQQVILPNGADAPDGIDWQFWLLFVMVSASFGFSAYSAWQVGGDAGVAEKLEEAQQDRDKMDILEKAYANSGKQIQMGFDNFTEFLIFVSQFTVLRSDDAFAKLAKDIQVPGAPDNLVPAPVTVPRETAPEGTLNEATPTV